MLSIKNSKIINSNNNKEIILKGVNLGGWLMMEAYILNSPNFPEHAFKENFSDKLGRQALVEFENYFRSNFITFEDFKIISKLGFNCVRIPFNYRIIEKAAFKYNNEAIRYLDKAIKFAGKNGIFVILDMHAAPGCQNHDWHSDSSGKSELFKNRIFYNRTLSLWEFLSDRYKNNKTVAGYDLLNESVCEDSDTLNTFYKSLIKTIRKIDKNHILFIEGNKWATDIECLDKFDDDNYALSVHYYEPIDFTFNFIPHLKYPLGKFNKAAISKRFETFKITAKKHGVPVFLGEFGVNARGNLFNEGKWVEDVVSCCREYGFNWTYWTYKAIKSSVFPDGIFSYHENPPWINRSGPYFGWDTFHLHWNKRKKEMIKSWHTKGFSLNKNISSILSKYAK